MKPTVKSV